MFIDQTCKRHFIIIISTGLYLDCFLQFLLLVVKSLSGSLFKCAKSKCKAKIPVNVEKKIFKNCSNQIYISVIWFPPNGEKKSNQQKSFFPVVHNSLQVRTQEKILPASPWEEKELPEDIFKQWGERGRNSPSGQTHWPEGIRTGMAPIE